MHHHGPHFWNPGDEVPNTGCYAAVTPNGHYLGIEAWMTIGSLFPDRIAGPGVEVRYVLTALGNVLHRAA